MRRAVLVTRPEPGLSETMRAVADLGFEPVRSPVFTIEALSPTVPRTAQAVLLTSGQAAAPLLSAAPFLRECPVLAVGAATAARAREAGFRQVDSADADAARLALLASDRLRPDAGPLLLACGRGQGAALSASLRRAGFRVHRRCVYRTRLAACLDRDALEALEHDRVLAALFFSAETAATFRRLLPARLRRRLGAVSALAIAARAGEELTVLGWRQVAIAAEPNAAALLSLLAHLPPG